MNNRVVLAAFLAAIFLLLFGCTGEDPETLNTSNTVEFTSTYQGLQTKIFDGMGCANSACHGGAAVGDLDLRADVSYSQLVGVKSTGSELNRVELGLRGRSYLYLKLLAASKPEDANINGAPMPSSEAPIPDNLLEALRLWIYAGAPETGTVPGTAELLGLELPPPRPITIEPLPKPASDEGFQLEMPNWSIGANSEREVCFASYYDVRDQVPDEFKDETGNFAFINVDELRQDPQSHHLILNRSLIPVEDINAPEFGEWSCRGGEQAGGSCDPTDLNSCGEGHCTTDPVDGFACIGFGPTLQGSGPFGTSIGIGGAQKSQDYNKLPEGVYRLVPLHGILYWNSHAFNLTDEDHVMNGRLNYRFATDTRYRAKPINALMSRGTIFLPNAPAYEREEVCSTIILPQGAQLTSLTSHTHKRGENFKIFHPDGSLIYENYFFSDPITARFEPPLVFDAEDEDARTLLYCAVYNNGVNPDGSPNPETVTRASRMPDSVNIPGVPGKCTPTACAAGKIGSSCSGSEDHATCDSELGAGDGLCDACAITGGESTENEMFLINGIYYVLDTENE